MSAQAGRPQRPHFNTHRRTNTGWQELAACVDANPNIFFDSDRYDDALAICKGCPVQKPCHEYGRGQADGVWGGKVHQKYKGRSTA